MPKDKQCFRVDIGTWSLSRDDGCTSIELEPYTEPKPQVAEDRPMTPAERVALFRQLLASGEVKNRAELARRYGLSRARISQLLGPGKKP